MRAFTAISVAKSFLSLAQKDPQAAQDLTNMKLQKLCYFAQLVAVCRNPDQPLISDPFHAWDWGPVEPKLFKLIKKFGAMYFSHNDANVAAAFSVAEDIENLDQEAYKIVLDVWEKFRTWTAVQLSALSHRKNSPWSYVYNTDRYGIIPIGKMVELRWGVPG